MSQTTMPGAPPEAARTSHPGPGTMSRRGFLGLAGLVAASVAIPVALTERQPPLAEVLVASRFLALVGSDFTFEAGDGRITLRLAEVEGVGRVDRTETAFTLRFDGPAARVQGGQVGQLSGPDLRGIPLLVVPSGRAVAGRQEWVATVVGGGPRG